MKPRAKTTPQNARTGPRPQRFIIAGVPASECPRESRMVRRIREALDKLPGGTLLRTRDLANHLGVRTTTLCAQSMDPALAAYRCQQLNPPSGGKSVLWASPATIKSYMESVSRFA